MGTEIDREALGWLVRVNDRAFAAWDAWDRWVAADPAHAEAYWRLAEAEGDAVDALAGAWFGWNERAQPWIIETAPGEMRTVTLDDGSEVSLAGGTRLTLDAVRVDHQGATETLNPGDGAMTRSRGIQRREVAIEEVAAWREGRLSYTGETLTIVAEDLSRALSRPIAVSPAVAARRFSGSLSTRDAPDQRVRLARLLGVSVVEDGEGWRLEP